MTTRQIAIVDNDSSIRRVLVRLVEAMPHDVEAFSSAEDLLSAEPKRFDCIILDVHMGRMSGVDLLETLSRQGGHPRAILVTARPNPKLLQRAQTSGASCFLLKPFRLSELEECIRRICND